MRWRALAVAAALLLVSCGDDEAGAVQLYDSSPVPAVPDRTLPVVEPLADGQYWGESVSADGETLTFVLMQAFFGPTCAAELGEAACVDEPGLIDDPTIDLAVNAADLTSTSVVTGDRRNYAVTGVELATLASGGTPASEAPDTFAYVPYPFLLTVRDGSIVEARQIWVP
jgi:hypothetical protein